MKIQITIEPGKYTGKAILWVQRHRATSGVLALLVSFVALWAAPITKPFTFANGGTVSASEMNSNFDTLYTKVNALDSGNIRYPDGLEGTIFSQILTNIATYTVPASKTLYIMASRGAVFIGSNEFCGGPASYGPGPCAIAENTTISGSGGNAYLTSGVLMDKSATIVNQNLTDVTTYTVPVGKTLVILSTRGVIFRGGSELCGGTTTGFPIMVGAGSVLSGSFGNQYGFTGFLK